jgi:hypothetical protein
VLFLDDPLFRVLHPEVNTARSILVGATAWVALELLWIGGLRWVPPVRGGLAILTSAFVSVQWIAAGWLVSRSMVSVWVHVALLGAVYIAIEAFARARNRFAQH